MLPKFSSATTSLATGRLDGALISVRRPWSTVSRLSAASEELKPRSATRARYRHDLQHAGGGR